MTEEACVGGPLRDNNRPGATSPLSLKNIYKGEEFGASYFFFSFKWPNIQMMKYCLQRCL